jgi:type I pantothenate kinase
MMASVTSLAAISDRLRALRGKHRPLIIGITGAVAAGKSTLAGQLAAQVRAWPGSPSVEIVGTDGFLLDNAALEARGALNRKGFPESYDGEGMRAALAAIRRGPASFPGYSHTLYDIDPALARRIEPPDVLIVEGLGLHEGAAALGLDVLIYLDADEADLAAWFAERFVGLWREAEHDPASFYARFRSMNEAQVRAFAVDVVWGAINLPNLREHIIRGREVAEIVVSKGADHAIVAVSPPRSLTAATSA